MNLIDTVPASQTARRPRRTLTPIFCPRETARAAVREVLG